MQPLLARVRRTIREFGLADRSSRVLAAVSGGSDSMALVHLLHELDRAGELRLAGLVHFNHQLRPAADADERFVVAAAAALDRPIFSDREDVAARARRERRSLEDAARAARYACFERARVESAADVVALGHTRDDQAETFLLRLVRGAGVRGLAGIYPRNERVIRPLLECRRQELREWLADRGTAFVDDETNTDVSIPRNRVRAELLPLLVSRFNPSIVDALADEADLARDAWEVIETAADQIAAQVVKVTVTGRVIDLHALAGTTAALKRVVLWRAMRDTAGARPVDFDHVAAATCLLDADGPTRMDAPGQRLERIGESLVLTGRPSGVKGRVNLSRPTDPGIPANLFWYPLSIPGEVQLHEAECAVSAEAGAGPPDIAGGAISGNGRVAIVREDLCRGTLAVRNRRRGDRFRPVGLNGRKKLQDFFVDRKVRVADRDRVPLVVDERDRIVWVAGYRIDEAFRVTEPGQAVLILRLRDARPGGEDPSAAR